MKQEEKSEPHEEKKIEKNVNLTKLIKEEVRIEKKLYQKMIVVCAIVSGDLHINFAVLI